MATAGNERPIRGVLVGAGFFAGFQGEAWQRVPGATLAGVCDQDPDRADAFAKTHGILETDTDLEALLDRTEPDFLDLVTRPNVRRPIIELAAKRKLPVICQKPLADTWNEAVELVRLCKSHGSRLIVHENWRFQPWFREAARLMASGAIGKPLVVSSRMRTGDGRGPAPYQTQPYFRQMKRFLVHETCVHFLDTFRYLMGDIQQVRCSMNRLNPIIAGEDAVWIHVAFDDGTSGTIDANRLTGPHPAPVAFGQTLIEGDEGAIRIDPEGRMWLAAGPGASESAHSFETTANGYKGDSVYALQVHATESLRNGIPAETEGTSYLQTLAAVFACYRSAEQGRAVPLKEIWENEEPVDRAAAG